MPKPVSTTDREGRPVAVQVYRGNTVDPKTVADEVHQLRERFGLRHVVLVGDRGLLSQARIDALKEVSRGWPGSAHCAPRPSGS